MAFPQLRILTGLCAAAIAVGCTSIEQSRADASRLSTYTLCMRLAAPGLLTDRSTLELWRETIASRGEGCSQHQADMDRAARRQSDTLQSLTTRLNQGQQPRVQPYTPPPTSSAKGFYRSSFRQGQSLICVYDRLGSPVYVTKQATDICPLTTD
jgi:hypothetical protein